MDVLQNLYPDCVWNIAEIKEEMQEVKMQMKEAFDYLSIRCKTEKGRVLSEKKLLQAEGNFECISIWWEVRKKAYESVCEKQIAYLKVFVKFRNRQLESNLSRKKKMGSLLRKLLESTELNKEMKKVFRLYVPQIKKSLPVEKTDMDRVLETLYVENMIAAVTICLGLNISRKGEHYYFCVDRRNQINENRLSIITSGKIWYWSDFSETAKTLFNQSGLTLTAFHMAEKMKYNEHYVSSLRKYSF